MSLSSLFLFILALLEEKSEDGEAEFISKAKSFYRSCMDEGNLFLSHMRLLAST